MKKNKITIIGVGNVGSTIAYTLYSCPHIDEIALIDIPEKNEKVESEILDMIHGLPCQYVNRIYCGNYSDCTDSKIIIITAGRNRKANESRLDLLDVNYKIVKEIVGNIRKHYNDSIVILLTNPNDILAHMIHNMNVFPYEKFFATGCMLDSSRFIAQIANMFQINNEEISGYVAGEHGDMQLILWSQLKIKNNSVAEYCEKNKITWNSTIMNDIQQKNKLYGKNIIAGKSFTNYGIASCVLYLIDSLINNKERTISLCCEMTGEFNIKNVALSLPTIINKDGIKNRMINAYSDIEIIQLHQVAKHLKNLYNY